MQILVLTEDSAADGRAVAQALVRAALQEVLEGLDTRKLVFAEGPVELVQRCHGRRWAEARYERTSFVRALATQLELCELVVVHYDSDAPWPGPSENERQFADRVRRALDRAAARAERLVEMVPYTAIESWCFRAVDLALALCRDRRVSTREHEAWAADPGLLETTLGLKHRSPLGDRCNLALVRTGWPRRDAAADGRSFARLVARIEAVPGLVSSLE